MSDPEDLCARLSHAFVAHDLDASESMPADGAVITQNGRSMSRAEVRPTLAAITHIVHDPRHDDV